MSSIEFFSSSKIFRFFLLVVFVLFLITTIFYVFKFSKENVFKGRISGESYFLNSSKVGIENVKIKLISKDVHNVWETMTNSQGEFQLTGIPQGHYELYLIGDQPPAIYYNFAPYDPYVFNFKPFMKTLKFEVKLNPLAQRDARRIKNLYHLQQALLQYKLIKGRYPIALSTQLLSEKSSVFQELKPYFKKNLDLQDYLDPLTKKGTRYFRYYSDGSSFQVTARGEIIALEDNLGWENSFYSEYQGRKLYNIFGK